MKSTGCLNAVSNIYEALGAVGFLEPQKVSACVTASMKRT